LLTVIALLVVKNRDGSLDEMIAKKVEEIREKYLLSSSELEVSPSPPPSTFRALKGCSIQINLTHQDKKELEKALKQPNVHSFDRAQKAIFVLMVEGTFDYFLKTDSYKQLRGATTLISR